MTAVTLRGTSTLPPDPRSGDASFRQACARWDYALLQDALAPMTKRDAVDHLASLFPHRTRSWHHRNFERLMSLTPDQLGRVLTYADPTGETATHRIQQERTAA